MKFGRFMILLFVWFGALIGVSAHAVTCDPFDASSFSAAIEKIRSTKALPKIFRSPFHPSASPQPSSEGIPDEVRNDFDNIQTYVFGRSVLSLASCLDCGATIFVPGMTVFLQPTFLAKIQSEFPKSARGIIRFLVAHEVSHIIHEWITMGTGTGLSPQGHIPLIAKSYVDYVDDAALKSGDAGRIKSEMEKYRDLVILSHCEVDGIAMLVLRKMGIDARSDAKDLNQFSIVEVKAAGGSPIDHEARLRFLETSFP